MRFYGKNYLSNRISQKIQYRKESRDALVDVVYPDQRKARVKIQGSSEPLYVFYPTNWKETPHWLKAGQAVRVRHTGGNRGRLEIESHSLLRPTLLPGDTEPTIPTPTDTIISGLALREIPDADVMKVYLTVGTVRFSGVSSTIYIKMSASTQLVMGYGCPMGGTAEVVNFSAAPATPGYARYDLVVIGSDLVFDVVTGTASATPVMPDTPAGHLLCGWVLITYGMTYITQGSINKYYAVPRLTSITLVSSDDILDWGESSCTLTATAYDQYGNTFSSAYGWIFTVEIVVGNGTLDNNEGQTGTTVSRTTSPGSASTTFTYTRGQLITDETPTIKLTIDGSQLMAAVVIILLDSSGDPM